MARAGSEKFVLEVVQRHEVANVRRRQRRATLPLVLVLAADANDSVSVQAHVEVQTKQTDVAESLRPHFVLALPSKSPIASDHAPRRFAASFALCVCSRRYAAMRFPLPLPQWPPALCTPLTVDVRCAPSTVLPPALQSRSGPSLSRTCARQTALSSHIATSMICRADGHWPAARARRASMTTSPSTLSSCSTRQRYARAPLSFPSSLGDTRV